MLIKQNVEKYLNARIDCDFIKNNEFNSDIAYYEHDKDVCNKIKKAIDVTKEKEPNYSEFGLYCLSKFVSYNEAIKLYHKRYFIDLSKAEKYRGASDTVYFKVKNFYWSDDIIFKDLLNKFITYDYKEYKFITYDYKEYSYSDDTLEIDMNQSLFNCEDYNEKKYFSDNHPDIIAPNIYMLMKWFIKQDKLTIIDKGNYIMFYFNNQKEFHLARTKDNDVYFRKEDFDDAINIIINKLL